MDTPTRGYSASPRTFIMRNTALSIFSSLSIPRIFFKVPLVTASIENMIESTLISTKNWASSSVNVKPLVFIAIAMNTNGLTLTEELAQFFVDIKVDSIMFSIDAVTKGTLKKIRGIDKLEKIESAVFRMMKVRGDAEYPRVGVSITI